jgi:hypothetical protein
MNREIEQGVDMAIAILTTDRMDKKAVRAQLKSELKGQVIAKSDSLYVGDKRLVDVVHERLQALPDRDALINSGLMALVPDRQPELKAKTPAEAALMEAFGGQLPAQGQMTSIEQSLMDAF